MIVTAKQHVLVDFTQQPPIPTLWDEDTDRTQHGVLITHDTGFKYLDVIGITADNGKDCIVTEIKHWQEDRGIWTFRDDRIMKTDTNTNKIYVEDQQFNIHTTRKKLVQVINTQVAANVLKKVPHFLEDNSQDFYDAWNYEDFMDIQVDGNGDLIVDEDNKPILVPKLRPTTLKSGYFKAYDFFSYQPQDFSKNYLQIAQIMAKYPAEGQGYPTT